MIRNLRWVMTASVIAIGWPAAIEVAAAQARSAGIRGMMVTGTPRRPVEGARISLVGTALSAVTDAKGLFSFDDLDPGQYVIQAAAIGFTTLSSPLMLKERETLEIEFEALEEAVKLPELTVEERSNHGPADWLRRKTEGRGRYITRQHLEERRAATIADALRSVPGLRIECRGSHVCAVRMVRAPRGCGPGYFMDGIPTDPAALWLTPVTQIEGIEVYSGPAETPPELEGASSRCGAIALWTRPPPPRRPREKKPKKGEAVDTTTVPADTTSLGRFTPRR